MQIAHLSALRRRRYNSKVYSSIYCAARYMHIHLYKYTNL